MVGLISNIGQSLGYTIRNTIFRPFLWIGLLITALIMLLCMLGGIGCLWYASNIVYVAGSPMSVETGLYIAGIALLIVGILIAFFFNGIKVQIFANKDITFKGFFGTFGRGVQLMIINIIYSLVCIIFFSIAVALGVFKLPEIAAGESASMVSSSTLPVLFPNGVTPLGIVMLVIMILLVFFFAILTLAADVNFARAGKFGAAFHFGEIFRRIGVFGILKFVIAIIIFAILMVIIGLFLMLIFSLIAMIPNAIAVNVISIIVALLLIPFLLLFPTKYFSNLFAD